VRDVFRNRLLLSVVVGLFGVDVLNSIGPVLPKRWMVERTFAWFNPYRRLSKDDEYYPSSSEAMIYLASVRLMLRSASPTRGSGFQFGPRTKSHNGV
jgi:hypothetical protein